MPIKKILDKVVGDKRRWRAYKKRVRALPDSHRTVVEGLERYLMYTGGSGDAESMSTMLEDLADLFERAAVEGTPVRAIVGDDPVAFADDFKRNYGQQGWLAKQQRRLCDAVDEAERLEGGPR